jgi:DNA mismatch repair protein MutS
MQEIVLKPQSESPTPNSLTPAMRQYLEIKATCKDAILFFRMGDFYEMFFEDAKLASRILNIALTSRDKNRENSIPMCGIPYHAANGYLAKLVKEGHKVALCEQVEDPKEAKGIVKRAVTKIITPGVVLEEELLDAKTNNFIASATWNGNTGGLSYMDVTTGEFKVTEFSEKTALMDEIKRIEPKELLITEESANSNSLSDVSHILSDTRVTSLSGYNFSYDDAAHGITGHFQILSLDGFGCNSLHEGVKAVWIVLKYVKETQKGALPHIKRLSVYHPHQYMVIDSMTKKNLELTETIRHSAKKGTLLGLLDKTKTAMGGRRLKHWLEYPLKDVSEITRRLDTVEDLSEEKLIRQEVQTYLVRVYDVERLAVRVALNTANPRDLVSLKDSLLTIPKIKNLLKPFHSALLKGIRHGLDDVREASSLIEAGIVDLPPTAASEGGFIRAGFNAELDELRDIMRDGRNWIARFEAAEKKRSGINSLKVRYNKIFGYYIEITKTNLSQAPPDYIRKQTLINAERFITPELKDYETKVLSAEERITELEQRLFNEIRVRISLYRDRILETASLLAGLDVFCSFAQLADEMGYARPKVNDGDIINIVEGRHPVIEANKEERFVSNDTILDKTANQIIILTGPNMAGKSTYIRQVALIVIMAQMGCFVPASDALIGAVDRVFTRIGASDDITRGHSTFMVEMNETSNILNNATEKSLIILDEIGRGTSTYDGLSIAWAVAEYIHDHPAVNAKTLFATHYHELTELSLTKERVRNYNMAVKEWNDKVIFLRKVIPGGSSRSYGIQVARLAGMPEPVIQRAKEILRNLEKGELNELGMPRLASSRNMEPQIGQMNLLGEKYPLKEELRKIETNTLTPLEALVKLSQLKEMAGEE